MTSRVIGFDDLPIARWPVFNLTTVRVAFEEMSEAVVELLLSQLAGRRRGASGPRVPHRAHPAPHPRDTIGLERLTSSAPCARVASFA